MKITTLHTFVPLIYQLMTGRIFLLLLVSTLTLNSCAQQQSKPKKKEVNKSSTFIPRGDESMATFASGCFWCAEEIFESLLGVREVVSGYAGGTAEDAVYEKVSRGETDHAESVQVYYDTTIITFDRLVKAFFDGHDPTTMNQQGPDVGRQYRSIAFYRNEKEKQIILDEINRLDKSGTYQNPIITEVEAFTAFYPAEDYHQDYILHHPDDPYVKSVSKPRYEKFKKTHGGKLKD